MLELIVYVSIVAVMAVLSVQAMFSIMRAFDEIKSFSSVRESGVITLERMIKEIRFSKSIDYTGTTFNTNPGRLKLNATDENGYSKIMEFYVSNGSLNIIDDGVEKGTITGSSTSITNFVLRESTTNKGVLIKIEMTIRDNRATNPKSVNFYGSAVLREAY